MVLIVCVILLMDFLPMCMNVHWSYTLMLSKM